MRRRKKGRGDWGNCEEGVGRWKKVGDVITDHLYLCGHGLSSLPHGTLLLQLLRELAILVKCQD